MMNKKFGALRLGLCLPGIFCTLRFGEECSKGALEGIFFCAEVLVPSVFPFMVMAVFIVKSGASQLFGRALGGFSRRVFGISGSMLCVLLLSVLGGYPVGARGIKALWEQRECEKNEAVFTSYAAVAAGPGFLINFIGLSLLQSREFGLCLLCAQIISVFLPALFNGAIFLKRNNTSDKIIASPPLPLSDALVESVRSASYGAFDMCAMVVIFSALISVSSVLAPGLKLYSATLLEVCSACKLAGRNVLLLAFAVGFGGLSVHFQIFTALNGPGINKLVFFLYRIIQGIFTAAFTYIFIKAFRISIPVFSTVSYSPELTLSSGLVGSALLILCAAAFVMNIGKGNEK